MTTALSELQDSVWRIRDIASDITAQAAIALGDANVRKRHETIQCSCVVILVGYFESFIRNLAKEAMVQLCAASPPFGTLDPKIQQTHFEHGGRILQSKASGRRKFSWILASREDIARRLDSVAGPGYEIVWEAFANTNASPGVDVVKEFLANFGIKKGWEMIASENNVTAQWARDSLDNVISVRNECAHTGAIGVVPAPSVLIQYADSVEAIAKALYSIVLRRIASIVAASNGAAGVSSVPLPAGTSSSSSVTPGVPPSPPMLSAPPGPMPAVAPACPAPAMPASPAISPTGMQ